MDLTKEQAEALQLYNEGGDLTVEAYAGTGKTTTIVALASSEARRESGTYVAYNRAIVDDVQSLLAAKAPWVSARTAHSLAFGSVGRKFKHRLHSERMSSREIAKRLGVEPVDIDVRGGSHHLAGPFLAGCVMEGTRNFANSADLEPAAHHLPGIEAIDDAGSDVNDKAVRAHLMPALTAAWDDLSSVSGSLRFSHDCYLKLWQLGEPVIPGKVLFVDEAQDVNPVLADVVERQGGQIVAVGDTYQQIYQWRGAVDSLKRLGSRPGVSRSRLTVSFRFGPEIAAAANVLLGRLGAPAFVVGAGAPGSIARAPRPDAILCRTNAGVISALLEHLEERPCAIVGGGGELAAFARGLQDLERFGHSTHPELVAFGSVSELESYVANDPSGSDLVLLVKLCVSYGPQAIIDAIELLSPETTPGVLTISTAHRAKGRQWDAVRLGIDWPASTLD
ncbi:MAG: UvrD-helicase domain-containing protein, partial [Dermatophilaceae bacterium]